MQIAKLILKQKPKVSPILKLQHWNKKKHTKQWKRTNNPEARMTSLLMRNKFFKQMVIGQLTMVWEVLLSVLLLLVNE